MEKTKYSFFHKPSKKDDIPLRLPKLIINNYEIQREESIKFLGVLLDQHLTWKEHIKLTENKIAKNIGILYKARPCLDKRTLLRFYYSYIYSYLNYANTAWYSTNRTYLKKFQSLQKHAIRIIFRQNKFVHTQEHSKENNTLNIYQLNIFNNFLFLHQVKNGKTPNAFLCKFLTLFRMGYFGAAHGWWWQKDLLPKISHTYPTMMKLSTVIPLLKEIQKIYQSRDTPLVFC